MTARPNPRLTWNLVAAPRHPASVAEGVPTVMNAVQYRTGPHKDGKGQPG